MDSRLKIWVYGGIVILIIFIIYLCAINFFAIRRWFQVVLCNQRSIPEVGAPEAGAQRSIPEVGAPEDGAQRLG
jgi:hypothetical protein